MRGEEFKPDSRPSRSISATLLSWADAPLIDSTISLYSLIPTVPVPVVFLVSHSSSDWAALDPNPRKALRPGEE
ncbi:hypothetical protein QYF36_026694 [Acer negundo]|nr:hypothetical protein QYF36_026694 [Acer negundo]